MNALTKVWVIFMDHQEDGRDIVSIHSTWDSARSAQVKGKIVRCSCIEEYEVQP